MSRRRIVQLSLIALAVALAAGPTLFVALQPVQVLPRMSLAPGFGLVDQAGERFTSDALRGGFVLYTLDYAGCGESCARTRGLFADVQARLEPGEIPVRLVTLGIDAERDTPERLEALASGLGADPSVWTFASGDSARVLGTVRDGFGFWYEPRPGGGYRFEPVAVLVDQFGIRRREYRFESLDAELVMADLDRLARESRAEGLTHLAYEAAHLFSCYAGS